MKNKIFVTKPFLPPIKDYFKLLENIWESGQLTNNSSYLNILEKFISNNLNINDFIAVSNGTIALQMAIKALGLKGEIIVPAFTWITTISAIKWENCTPIFCDINKDTLNIDVNKIEELITNKTSAILPVHVFGNPCDVIKLNEIAEKHNLKLIYDAAHAFGSTFKNQSIFKYGDISATSMHATKLFSTGEGGGCISNYDNLNDKLRRIRTFGFQFKIDNSKDVLEDGINGKLCEINAALGVVNLKYINNILLDRKEKYSIYFNELSNNPNIQFQKNVYGQSNYSYFPIILNSEEIALLLIKKLNKEQIYPRRYFYPSANTFQNIVKYSPCPISESISSRILCLPLYFQLKQNEILNICQIINKTL